MFKDWNCQDKKDASSTTYSSVTDILWLVIDVNFHTALLELHIVPPVYKFPLLIQVIRGEEENLFNHITITTI